MKGTILLNYTEDTRQVEDEEKSRFLKTILEQCFENTDVVNQINSIWPGEGVLSPSQKIQLRSILSTYGIQVIDNLDGHLQIYAENQLMAEWFKCTYKLKKDLRVINPRERVYLEMQVNCWSVFDPKEDSDE